MTQSGKTLVTGGTGFVGRAVVEELLAAGREVRVLARNPEHPALAGLAVDVTKGDLRDPDSLERALTGCTRLFHVAADYRLWVPDPATMYAVNVDGTRQVLTAAAALGLEPGSLYQHRGHPGQPRGRHPRRRRYPGPPCGHGGAL